MTTPFKWIPVAQELPEAGIFCLVSGHGKSQFIAFQNHRQKWVRPNASTIVGITHWMHLPPPPED